MVESASVRAGIPTPQRGFSYIAAGLVALACLAGSVAAAASQYGPEGLYDVEHLTLDNGFQLVLKPRAGARTVALRLVVGVGTSDFPCGRQETPHFLEHLLFAGTADHDEAELDSLIESHGGVWNATTETRETTYEIDIYSGYGDLAIDVLHEMMTESTLSEADVATTRDIIYREMGGRPSALRRWLYRHGVGKSAFDEALETMLPSAEYWCPDLETADRIGRDDILATYETYYVPNNMTLVAVGDFDRDRLVAQVEERFGTMQSAPLPERATAPLPAAGGRTVHRSLFSPIVSSEGEVALFFRTSGYDTPDEDYALYVLSSYLSKRLFEALRIDRGLAYDPGAEQVSYRNVGLVYAYADLDLDDMESGLEIIENEIDKLRTAPLDRVALDETKRGLLLSEAQGYESNAAHADYYVANLDELETRGRFLDHAALIDRVTVEDVQRVAERYLGHDRGAVIWSEPTLTQTQFYVGIGALGSAMLILAIRIVRRRARR